MDFFFSSRRRHTRWPRDWSSDVCSSDLSIWRISLVLKLECANRFFESTILLLVSDLGFIKANSKLLGKVRKFLNKSNTEPIPLIFATLVLSIDSGKPI